MPSLILQPLIENALKYAVAPREEGGRLRIEGRVRGWTLELAVQDDGPGLPPACEPGNGRGVGLRNTRERLAALYPQRHGIKIVDAQPGLAHRDHPAVRTGRATMSIRAIVVDDEELARRGLEIRLRDEHDVEIVAQCANGRAALAAIEEHAPDLMFLDIQMPGLSGLDVLARVPQESMPMVVFVTAFDRFAIDAFETHALDYLLKPVDDARLRRALDRVRAQWHQRQALAQREQLMALLADLTGKGELDAGCARRAREPPLAAFCDDAADPDRPRHAAARRDDDRLDRRGGRLHVPARRRCRRTCCARR